MASGTDTPLQVQNFAEMFDFWKIMDQFKIPGLDNKGLVEAHRKNIEALSEANRVAFDNAQAMVRRQTEILQEAMHAAATTMQEVQHASSNEERVGKQTEFAKSTFELALKHGRELAEMSAKSQNEALELLNKRVVASFDGMRESMQTVVKQSEKATGEAIEAAQKGAQTAAKGANGEDSGSNQSGGSSSPKQKSGTSASTSAS